MWVTRQKFHEESQNYRTQIKEFSSETVKLKFLNGSIYFLIKNSDPLFQKFKSEVNSKKIGF